MFCCLYKSSTVIGRRPLKPLRLDPGLLEPVPIFACLRTATQLQAELTTQSEATTNIRTALSYVGFKGDPKNQKMDMSQLGKVQAENAASHQVDGVKEKKGGGYTTIR